ncbi:hypothetical protein TYM08_P3630 [Marinicellulosiphila megalodicopiae]
MIPDHYLHSSGNFHIYDSKCRVLMSGKVWAASKETDAPLYLVDPKVTQVK